MKVSEGNMAVTAPDTAGGPAEESLLSVDPYLGRRLGPYVLLQRIGEGGMGAVYRARRPGSEEDVAIKVIKRGMDTDLVLRRFENERRILTSVLHPNVSRLLGGGTTADGLPYFVMEYIAGQPLHRYCGCADLSIEGRLRLFLKICSAVQRAHELHVIHRDIKPENILVTRDGEPKLLDFGIAKILDPAPGSQDVTLTACRLMTPSYASPEQARGGAITAATDIYSLGVVLYELVTGASPYRPADDSPRALADALFAQQPRLASRAAPAKWRRQLSGDLDGILQTALAKEPADRYASVSELAADLDRHLRGARVRARRNHAQFSPFRGRMPSIIPIVALACSIVIGSLYLWRRDAVPMRPAVALLGFENLSGRASEEWLSTALTEMISTELSAGGRVRTAPGNLVSRVKLELALPTVHTFTRPTLHRLRKSLNTDFVVLGSYLAAGEGADERVRVDVRLQDTRSGDLIVSLSETREVSDLAALAARAGGIIRREVGGGGLQSGESSAGAPSVSKDAEAPRSYSEGLRRLRAFDTLAARDLLRNAVTAAPGHAQSHAALALACSLLGYDMEAGDEARKAVDLSARLRKEDRLSIQGRFYETTRQWDKAIETFRLLWRDYPDNLEYGLQLATMQSHGGASREAMETLRSLRALPSAGSDPRVDLAEAQVALASSDLGRARATARRTAESAASQGLRILAAHARLLEGRIALQLGDPDRALSAAAEARQLYLATGHRQGTAWALNEMAGVLTQRGDVDTARTRYEEALEVCRTVGDQSCISTDLDSIGVLKRRQGDLRGALAMHQESMEVRRAIGDRAGVATCLYNVANVLGMIGDLQGARNAAAEALDIRSNIGERRSTALTRVRLANIRRREGGLADALAMTEQALSELSAIGDRGGVALAMLNLGLVLFDLGDLARSRAVLEDALAIRRQQQDKNNTAQVLGALAAIALAQARLADAERLIDDSISLRRELGEAISLAQSKLVLAEVLLQQGRIFASEQAAHEAGTTFHNANAWGREGEAALALARAQLGRNDIARARASIDAAGRLLRESKDAQLLLRRDSLLARVEFAMGRKAESAALLERAQREAARLRFAGLELEIRLARAQTGQAPSGHVVQDAHAAGFLLIERKARVPHAGFTM